jgi:hypothetical protein
MSLIIRRLIQQVLQFRQIGEIDLALPDVDELFGPEIAERPDQGFSRGPDICPAAVAWKYCSR